MAITITHPATMQLTVTFDDIYKTWAEKNIDDVTEMACDVMVEHNFHIARITDIRGHILVEIERS